MSTMYFFENEAGNLGSTDFDHIAKIAHDQGYCFSDIDEIDENDFDGTIAMYPEDYEDPDATPVIPASKMPRCYAERIAIYELGVHPTINSTPGGHEFLLYSFTPQQLKEYLEFLILEVCEFTLDHLDSEYIAGDIATRFDVILPEDFGE